MSYHQQPSGIGQQALIRLIVLACLLLNVVIVRAQGPFVYVSNGTAPNSVSGFKSDSSGTMTPLPGSPFDAEGVFGILNDFSNATIQVNRDFLFVCNAFSHQVSVFRIRGDGVLTPVQGSPFATGGRLPIAVTANPQGTRLFVLNYGSIDLSVFTIARNGGLQPVTGSPFSLRPLRQPTGLALSPNGQMLIVGSNGALSVYQINSDGSPTPAGMSVNTGTGTQALVMTPNGKYLYAAALDTNAISGWSLSSDGQLAALPDSPYPMSSSHGASGLAISSKAIGQLLFATASGESGIYGFRIGLDGALTAMMESPFPTAGQEVKPIGVEPDGDFLYTADIINRLIHVFRVNVLLGTLMEIDGSPFPTGVTTGRPVGLALK